MSDGGWEERMAERARERQAQLIDDRTHPAEFNDAESWLNGWSRIAEGDSVLIGAGVHCVGCGFCYGITSVAFVDGWNAPERMPDYPYPVDACPGWHE